MAIQHKGAVPLMPEWKVSPLHTSKKKQVCKLTCENFVIGVEQRDFEPNSVKQAREVETSSWACKMIMIKIKLSK